MGKKLQIFIYSLIFLISFIIFIWNLFTGVDLLVIISFVTIFLFFIGILETKKYNQNNPYEKKQIKKNVFLRMLTGLFAGIHYAHAIFTYNHEKYNTQVFEPETLECYFGWSWFGILFIYGYAAFKISNYYEGYWYLFILLIPVITNIISLFWSKSNRNL